MTCATNVSDNDAEYHNHNNVETPSLPPASPIVIDSVHGTPVIQEPSAQIYPDFLGRPPDDNDIFGSMSVSNPVDKLQLVDAWRHNDPPSAGVGAGTELGAESWNCGFRVVLAPILSQVHLYAPVTPSAALSTSTGLPLSLFPPRL